MTTRRTTLLFALLLPAALPAQRPPGYDGTFPGETARQALREVAGKPWEDTKKVAGGGTWELYDGGVTPHALGPCRGDVAEMRTVETKGPHLRLVRGHLEICFPTTTDGDVAATLRWLGKPVPAGVTGEPTANWQRAAARLAGLGEEAGGVRVGLAETGRPGRVELVVWKVGTDPEPLVGRAALEIDGTPLPLRLVWPEKQQGAAAISRLHLDAGSTSVETIDIGALLREHGREHLKPGMRLLQATFAREVTGKTAGGTSQVARSTVLQHQVPDPDGARAGKVR